MPVENQNNAKLSHHNLDCFDLTILSIPATKKVAHMTSASAVKDAEDRAAFEQSMKILESQVANVGAHVTIDSTTRLAYAREIKAMAKKLESDALSGRMSWMKRQNRRRKLGI